MKLSELEQLVKRLRNVEEQHLNAIQKYMDALDKATHGPNWFLINFDEELKTLEKIGKWVDKKLAECRRLN